MDVERLKDDARAGRIGIDRQIELIDQIEALSRELEAARRRLGTATRELEAAKLRIAELEKELGRKAAAPTPKTDEPYSMKAEERRQEARGKRQKAKQRRRAGRKTSAAKLANAERTEQVFPVGVPPEDCTFSHSRPVWRLENGRAVLVAYDIYRGPKSQYGKIPGVLGRGQFGLEIMIAIAYKVYIVGLSFDKVIQLYGFFQNLQLGKSQINAMLSQLQRHWEKEFEVLCELLANSLIVHADETSWSIKSVWTFVSEMVRLLIFGVHKDGATLETILNPETFLGTFISDDAPVYGHFTHAQKCWAHLLRKAIKLALLDPSRRAYRKFLDELLAIYQEACRVQADGRLSDEGRRRKVDELNLAIIHLCAKKSFPKTTKGLENEFRLLVAELLRLRRANELFTFVTTAAAAKPNGESMPAPGTNNESERTLRGVATARKTGRTNKTPSGARRQTVIVSTLESLRYYLKTFTLKSVIEEVLNWTKVGKSCFEFLRDRLKRAAQRKKTPYIVVVGAGPPILDRLYPTAAAQPAQG